VLSRRSAQEATREIALGKRCIACFPLLPTNWGSRCVFYREQFIFCFFLYMYIHVYRYSHTHEKIYVHTYICSNTSVYPHVYKLRHGCMIHACMHDIYDIYMCTEYVFLCVRLHIYRCIVNSHCSWVTAHKRARTQTNTCAPTRTHAHTHTPNCPPFQPHCAPAAPPIFHTQGSSTRVVHGQVVVRRNIIQKLFHIIYVLFRAIYFFFKTLVVPLNTIEPPKRAGGTCVLCVCACVCT